MDPWCDVGQQCPAREILIKLNSKQCYNCTLSRKVRGQTKSNLCVDGSGSGDTEEQVRAASRQESAACDAPVPGVPGENLWMGEVLKSRGVMHLHQVCQVETYGWEKFRENRSDAPAPGVPGENCWMGEVKRKQE